MTTPMCAHDVRRIAVASTTDPRTVHRYLRGEAIRSMSKVRIVEALKGLGMDSMARAVVAEHLGAEALPTNLEVRADG